MTRSLCAAGLRAVWLCACHLACGAVDEEAISRSQTDGVTGGSVNSDDGANDVIGRSNDLANGREVPFTIGMDLGVGYHVRTGELLTGANCLAPFQVGRNPAVNRIEKSVTVAGGAADLAGALGIEATFSFLVGPVTVNVTSAFEGVLGRSAESVFAIVVIERRIAATSIERPALAPKYASMFDADPEAFASRCGDHFIQSITTGARYVGLIEIAAATQADRIDIVTKLKGSLAPLGVSVSGGLKLVVAQLASRYRVKMHTLTQGVSVPAILRADTDLLSQLPSGDGSGVREEETLELLATNDLQQFFDDAQAFYEQTAQIGTDASYRAHALWVALDSYGQLRRRGHDPAALLQDRQSVARAVDRYAVYAQELEEMVRYPERFRAQTGGSATEAPSDDIEAGVDTTAIEALAAQVRHALRLLKRRAMDCSRHRAPTCPTEAELAALPIVTPEEIEGQMLLRRRSLPRSCGDLRDDVGVTVDGSYTVYLRGREDLPYDVYCTNMDDTETDRLGNKKAAGTFITVGAQDTTDCAHSRPPYNYSIIHRSEGDSISEKCQRYGEDAQASFERVVRFGHVPVHVAADFVVVKPQMSPDGTSQVRYGTTTTCAEHAFAASAVPSGNSHPEKMANIDLRDSPWRLATSSRWFFPSGLECFCGEEHRVSFDVARERALELGGDLPTLAGSLQVERLRNALREAGVDEPVWIGLRAEPGDDRYGWVAQVSYDYTPWIGHPAPEATSPQCVAVTPAGDWQAQACDEHFGYVVQHGRSQHHVVVSEDGRQADLYLSSVDGTCISLEPQSDLVLEYAQVGGAQ